MPKKSRLLNFTILILLLLPYLLYVGFIIYINRGPIDYETFMSIGHRLLSGGPIYADNTYYPMPFLMIFAFFSWLPRPISMVVWLLGPVLLALYISGGNPLVLAFAPLFGHLVGGQSAVFAMVGLWGYRKYIDSQKALGGIFLALTLLKPQLGIIPLAYAIVQWLKEFNTRKRIPKQTLAWLITLALLYLPGFLLQPDWMVQWLGHPRPLFERALSGIVPRALLSLIPPQTAVYWLVLAGVGALLLWGLWLINRRKTSLDLAVLWGFIVSPLVHDYDLIQLIPLLDKPILQVAAFLLSIPGWLVILFAYQNNSAWAAFTIIAPGLLCVLLYLNRKMISPPEPGPGSDRSQPSAATPTP